MGIRKKKLNKINLEKTTSGQGSTSSEFGRRDGREGAEIGVACGKELRSQRWREWKSRDFHSPHPAING